MEKQYTLQEVFDSFYLSMLTGRPQSVDNGCCVYKCAMLYQDQEFGCAIGQHMIEAGLYSSDYEGIIIGSLVDDEDSPLSYAYGQIDPAAMDHLQSIHDCAKATDWPGDVLSELEYFARLHGLTIPEAK